MSKFRVSLKVQFPQELTTPQAEVLFKDLFGGEAEVSNLTVRTVKEKRGGADRVKKLEGEVAELKTLANMAKTPTLKDEIQKLLHRKEVRLERVKAGKSKEPRAPKVPKAPKTAKADKVAKKA